LKFFNGVVSMTIEDASGDANVVLRGKVSEQHKQALCASLVPASG
jgi:hypothetical protein